MTHRRPTIDPAVVSQILDPAQRSAVEAEYAAWQAEMAQREQTLQAEQEAKEKRRAQRMRALRGEFGEVAPRSLPDSG